MLVLGTGILNTTQESGQGKIGGTEGPLDLWIGSPEPIQARTLSGALLPRGPQVEDQLHACVGRPPWSHRIDVLAQVSLVGLDIDAEEKRNDLRPPAHASGYYRRGRRGPHA